MIRRVKIESSKIIDDRSIEGKKEDRYMDRKWVDRQIDRQIDMNL